MRSMNQITCSHHKDWVIMRHCEECVNEEINKGRDTINTLLTRNYNQQGSLECFMEYSEHLKGEIWPSFWVGVIVGFLFGTFLSCGIMVLLEFYG